MSQCLSNFEHFPVRICTKNYPNNFHNHLKNNVLQKWHNACNTSSMHYFKLAFRNLQRQPLYSGINVVSLAIGMAAAMLIGLWTYTELNVDCHHRHADQLWRVTTDLNVGAPEHWYWGSTPLRLSELAVNVPGVVQVAQIKTAREQEVILRKGGTDFLIKGPVWVSDTWFKTFDFATVEGAPQQLSEHPNNIVLSEKKAREIFGKHDPIGQVLQMDSTAYTVCGVVADPGPQSSIQFELMFPVAQLLADSSTRENETQWGNFNFNTFVELHPNANTTAVAQQLTSLLQAAKQDSGTVLGLQPLADMHFDTQFQDDFEKGSRNTVGVFIAIGLLLLLMACINYVSLATARSLERYKEIGIKKVVGARNGHIFKQVMAEASVLAVISGVLALLLGTLAMPYFNQLAQQKFDFGFSNPLTLALAAATLLLTLLFSGLYPAWIFSRFGPINVARMQPTGAGQRSPVRKGLVVVQFLVSAVLLVGTIVIGQQRKFIQEKPLGYARNDRFTFNLPYSVWGKIGRERARSIRDAMLQQLQGEASVETVSLGSDSPVHITSTHSGSVKHRGLLQGEKPSVSQVSADANYASTFDLQMTDGRWFEANSPADVQHIVLNETAARQLRLPEPWVGQYFGFQGKEGQVIGIVKDFHFASLHHPIKPLVIHNAPGYRFQFFLKTKEGSMQTAIATAEKVWKGHFPDYPFQYKVLDDKFEQLYGRERRAGLLFQLFAGIAIAIACMGLFGLAVFMAARRTKEIGVRKVLGASVANITALLAKDFLVLVVIAIALATPIAYYCMGLWLSNFAYRIELQWWMFGLAALLAIAIALLTVGFHSVRAALADPAKSLNKD